MAEAGLRPLVRIEGRQLQRFEGRPGLRRAIDAEQQGADGNADETGDGHAVAAGSHQQQQPQALARRAGGQQRGGGGGEQQAGAEVHEQVPGQALVGAAVDQEDAAPGADLEQQRGEAELEASHRPAPGCA